MDHLKRLAVMHFYKIFSEQFNVDKFLDAVDYIYRNTVNFGGQNKVREMATALCVEKLAQVAHYRGKLEDESRQMNTDFVLDVFCMAQKLRRQNLRLRIFISCAGTVFKSSKDADDGSMMTTCNLCKNY